eukprot:scaffold43360_cov27-Tisochrysis_lutea.AAC.2
MPNRAAIRIRAGPCWSSARRVEAPRSVERRRGELLQRGPEDAVSCGTRVQFMFLSERARKRVAQQVACQLG